MVPCVCVCVWVCEPSIEHTRLTDEDYCNSLHPARQPAKLPRFSPLINVVSSHVIILPVCIHTVYDTEGSLPKTRTRPLDISQAIGH